MSAMLEVRGLSAGYGKVDALSDVSLRLDEDQVVSVIGPNGAGKTTLLSAIMGIIGSRGSVIFDGCDLCRVDAVDRVAMGISLVPEHRELFASMSVEDNLLLGGYARVRRGDKNIASTLDEVFSRFPRLHERRRQFAGTLSGGERQTLAIGRALMNRPRLLLLDEPSLGLAPLVIREIFSIIADLRNTGVSLLVVEQNARAALRLSSYAYVLETGALVMEGPAEKLAKDQRIIDSYLGLSERSISA